MSGRTELTSDRSTVERTSPPMTPERVRLLMSAALMGSMERSRCDLWIMPCAQDQPWSPRRNRPVRTRMPGGVSRQAKLRKGGGVCRRCSKPFVGTQWVKVPSGKGWQPAGSESCVVVSDGGTKRRQRVQKPCDRTPKVVLWPESSPSHPWGQHRDAAMPGVEVGPGSESGADAQGLPGNLGEPPVTLLE
jgi:hypothetical protein